MNLIMIGNKTPPPGRAKIAKDGMLLKIS